jgi:transcriptional regulator GlxA family with amidase domain
MSDTMTIPAPENGAHVSQRLRRMARIIDLASPSLELGSVDALLQEAERLVTILVSASQADVGYMAAGGAMGGLTGWQVRAVTRLVEVHLSGRLKTIDLAQCAGLSTRHFARAFRQSFGVTPMAYVREARLERAKLLLRSTDIPLRKVALECGYSDQAHFSRAVRAATGMPPRQWRHQIGPAPIRQRQP